MTPSKNGLRALAVLVAMGVCSGCANAADSLSVAERHWAEGMLLEIATVGDIMALEVLPSLLPDLETEDVVVVGDDPLDPNWHNLRSACASLGRRVSYIGALADSAPVEMSAAAQTLRQLEERLRLFSDDCRAAADMRDIEALEGLSNETSEMQHALEQLARGLPDDVECPADASPRPRTCDA